MFYKRSLFVAFLMITPSLLAMQSVPKDNNALTNAQSTPVVGPVLASLNAQSRQMALDHAEGEHAMPWKQVENGKYECKLCNKVIKEPWVHNRIHTGDRPYACGYEGCNNSYTSRQSLRVHLKNAHAAEKSPTQSSKKARISLSDPSKTLSTDNSNKPQELSFLAQKIRERLNEQPLLSPIGVEVSESHKKVLEQPTIEKEIISVPILENRSAIFVNAIRAADLGKVQQLIMEGYDVNAVDDKGVSALVCAASKGYAAIVDLLIKAGAEVDKRTASQDTALMYAAHKGHSEIVQKLINAKAHVNNHNGNGVTALLRAVHGGFEKIVDKLIEAGADVNKGDSQGVTALMSASLKGYTTIVKKLLAAGAHIALKSHNKKTALEIAKKSSTSNKQEIIELLEKNEEDFHTTFLNAVYDGDMVKVVLCITAGINVNKPRKEDGVTALMIAACKSNWVIGERLISRGADIDAQDIKGQTALMYAAGNGQITNVYMLLANKANVKKQTLDGNTALTIASQNGHGAVVQILMEYDRPKTIQELQARIAESLKPTKKTIHEATVALFKAIEANDLGVVQQLIAKGIDLNLEGENSYTALMVACQQGYVPLVEQLIAAGANIHMTNSKGQTALMLAAERGHTLIVDILLERKAEVNAVDEAGTNALMNAIVNGHESIVKKLIDHKADVNALQNQTTALMRAVVKGYVGIVDLLISAGANVNQQQWNGTTALRIAVLKGNQALIKKLMDAGARY